MQCCKARQTHVLIEYLPGYTLSIVDQLWLNTPRARWSILALNTHAVDVCNSGEVAENERGRVTGDGGKAVAYNRERLDEAGN